MRLRQLLLEADAGAAAAIVRAAASRLSRNALFFIAAAVMGIDQPQVSALLGGRLTNSPANA